VNQEQLNLQTEYTSAAILLLSQFDTQTSKKEKGQVKISTEDVHVYYGEAEAIKGIDLNIYQNEVIAFIGPSGCGKSTFCVL
jgi:phosphate transport system ATP-binding protein